MKRYSISTNGLDRFSIHRSDKTWILDEFYDERSQIIPVHDLTVLCENAQDPKAVYLTHKNELEEVCWFTREEIRANWDILPSKVSIAYKLIMEWLERGD